MEFKDPLDFVSFLDKIGGRRPRYLIKHEERADDLGYGVYPWRRSTEQLLRLGLINLDKPPGPTSHEVAAWIKRLLNLGKVGHAGTLDL